MSSKTEMEVLPKLENLNLGRIGEIFKNICKIPHGSGDESKLCDYIENLAKKNEYESIRDDAGNILIIIPGNTNKDGIIFQTHMDMVKEPDNMTSVDPELIEENSELWIRSKNEETTLGADNGIMLAFQLNLMEELKGKKHGNIALLFTTEEETGMGGANNLGDNIKSRISSNYKNFINLDNETDNELVVSSAGFGLSKIFLRSLKDVPPEDKKIYKVSVSGLPGGHSGIEIDKNIPNAIKLIGEKLDILNKKGILFNIVSIGGDSLAINKIPNNCEAIIAVDKNLTLEYPEISLSTYTIFNEEFTDCLIALINQLPDGVMEQNGDLSPKLSSNFGIIKTTDDGVEIHISTRSSSDDLIKDTRRKIATIAELKGFYTERDPILSGWEASLDNQLYDCFINKDYKKKFIHAGLECGTFKNYFKNINFISIGPTIIGAHTKKERVRVESVNYINKILLQYIYGQ